MVTVVPVVTVVAVVAVAPVVPAAQSLSSTCLRFTYLARLHFILCSTSSAFGFSSDEAHALTLTRPSLRPTASKPVR